MVLEEAFYGFRWNLLRASFYFIAIMKFYPELLHRWSEVRSVFDSRRECQYILWNNKEIRVDNKPVFYKKKKKNFLNKISFS